MITKLAISEKDIEVLASINHTPSAHTDDFFDYRNVVIAKPWGYEYLIFQNDHAAVWMLHMKQGHRTSMHCHPNKKTSLTVLAGNAKCMTLASEHVVAAAQGLLIDKGVFHSTEAMSPDWVVVMEVETPTNKQDLVRAHDAYGRSGMRYEGNEHHRAHDKGVRHFHDEEERYGSRKRFGDCEVSLVRHTNADDFTRMLHTTDGEILTILKGNIHIQKGVIGVGDVLLCHELRAQNHVIEGEVEALLIKKVDPLRNNFSC